MLRYQRDITTISRCPLRRWLQLRETTAGDQLFMCACIPLVWLTQPEAASQGCCIRTSDLHSPLGPNLLVVGSKPGNGKGNRCSQMDCGKCRRGLVCNVLARSWKPYAFENRADGALVLPSKVRICSCPGLDKYGWTQNKQN